MIDAISVSRLYLQAGIWCAEFQNKERYPSGKLTPKLFKIYAFKNAVIEESKGELNEVFVAERDERVASKAPNSTPTTCDCEVK